MSDILTDAPSNNEDNSSSFPTISSWDDLDINPLILRGIYAYGFEKPSPIQSKAIMPIFQGRDIIAQAQSGTGKTAAFSIGALSRINFEEKCNQVLIISPTHELSRQIMGVISGLGSCVPDFKAKVLVGGSSIDEDAEDMRANVYQVVVGCPGRVYDMMRRNHISSKKIKLVILDEADEMLSSGFKDQVYNIFQNLHKDVQVALFSATLPLHIYGITSKFMRDPVKISVQKEKLTLEGIQQYFVALDDDGDKYSTLKDLYSYITVSQCIIYCNSVKRVIHLYEAMKADGFPVVAIHREMSAEERKEAITNFRKGESRVLISSNVTARGIDIQQVSVVINFDIPKDIHTYIHRIGRSGRWGRKGVGINFITRRDIPKIREIEQYYQCQIDALPDDIASVFGR